MEQKSWLSKVLPKDEYKEKKMLYYIAESAVLLAILLFIYALINNFSLYGGSASGTVTLLSLCFLVAYVLIRYIMSGIEYPDIIIERRFKKEKQAIINRSLIMMVLIAVMLVVIQGIPSNMTSSVQLFLPAIFISFINFIISYTSLKKSYHKNIDLLD
ncbi:hypothetical protein [Niallia sp. MER 6]|uniref:hypothetical protein n=1 Tax=Niallia sp. MER 6 TaxID=2939567 RepID=UPI00203B4867|nr:hypothetical protein [Niallia sp. MER 6]MCM3033104.1 hypothetical protein [Niallia sp. MER 6]